MCNAICIHLSWFISLENTGGGEERKKGKKKKKITRLRSISVKCVPFSRAKSPLFAGQARREFNSGIFEAWPRVGRASKIRVVRHGCGSDLKWQPLRASAGGRSQECSVSQPTGLWQTTVSCAAIKKFPPRVFAQSREFIYSLTNPLRFTVSQSKKSRISLFHRMIKIFFLSKFRKIIQARKIITSEKTLPSNKKRINKNV